jgi:RimJ/RimL family protein N-acetyltransferase
MRGAGFVTIMSTIRILNGDDAEAYRTLRLRSLREHPEAFGSSYDDEAETPIETTRASLQDGPPSTIFFGAFDGERLVGLTGLMRNLREKQRHRAVVAAVYVEPQARGKGYARALLDAALDHARAQAGLTDVVLAVTVGNETARRLYVNAEFTPYMIEPRYLKIGDRFYDMEWLRMRLDQQGDPT